MPEHNEDGMHAPSPPPTRSLNSSASLLAAALLMIPSPALAAASDPIPAALFAWLHFLGLAGVAGGLVAERFMIHRGLSLEEEIKVVNADGIYGLSALSLLVSGYFRVTIAAKGWEYYQHEPVFWLKMSAVAVLGGLSFFPTIILVRRDLARKEGDQLQPLSDAVIDRMTTVMNAELLALTTIPLLASLMARGVLYTDSFPWILGAMFYAVSLGGAGFKYGTEAVELMEQEGALQLIDTSNDE